MSTISNVITLKAKQELTGVSPAFNLGALTPLKTLMIIPSSSEDFVDGVMNITMLPGLRWMCVNNHNYI